ncbi:MAG TPA: FAD-dependent oxidoreductase [Caulobacteraceae bacterium]|nr:FAD-dependent oxidoreductase [Caulobacteraceae bacterium]
MDEDDSDGAPPARAQVLVAGGGPCGLMLANELGRRGVTVAVVDEKPGTAVNPQANATQARTMEHYRRLGFADEVRALGLPSDYPTDVGYFTRYAGHELARFALPAARDAKAARQDGYVSAPEPPHRISQKFVEPVLRRHAAALPGISLHYGWRLANFTQDAHGVRGEVERVSDGRRAVIAADYLMGADGARSPVRHALDIRHQGEARAVRHLMGGRMYAVYLRAPDFYAVTGMAKAWMHVTFNHDRRAFMMAVDGKGEFAFHTQLRPGEDENEIDDARAVALFQAAVGAPVAAEVITRAPWNAGYSLVAERFGQGRVFLGGDAAHLFTPAGGLGYNTAVEDAVNLGWKLAAVLKGRAAPALLESYEAERRPLAQRNTAYAKGFADGLGLLEAPPELEDDTPQGEAARAAAGRYFDTHARKEFDIPGVTFGGRYDGSPAIVADGTAAPPDAANLYVPTACPGGRAPHLWLDDGASLYDRFGFEWTLMRMGTAPADGMISAARARGLDLTVLDVLEARPLYEADLALIRPDQIVAWRGDAEDADVWAQILDGRPPTAGAAAQPA